MGEEDKLRELRARIDGLDEQIQDLISERAGHAREIAQFKRTAGNANGCYRPEREAQVLRQVRARNRGPLPDEDLLRIFREIISSCLAVEETLKVAFLGPEGTFTQAAALRHFGHAVGTAALGTIEDVFREVEAGGAHYGVVPVENSTEGVVHHTLDRFLRSPLRICGEVELRIHHHLLGRVDGIEAVRQVFAHQQSLAQCRGWLDRTLPQAERIAVSSNGEAARQVRDAPGAAAIAGDTAAELYDLKVLASNIEDEPDNTTRFLVIGPQEVPPSGADKTSLLVSTRNQPGALARLLEPLARNGISMTRIESRPSRRGVWEYVFFVDLAGHIADTAVAQALVELEREATLFKVLGSYPRASL
ncbi:MAG: chorismate mutase [Chromatiales bacterium 21-64-14]|nr:MAG: chorismate mutase [Chromatiales bacterium 21-64-14]HQU15378.1 prephenate dehydratase [Gammaproteobacteria bacterium]